MTASVRAVLMDNLLTLLGGLAGEFAGLVVERDRPEAEPVDSQELALILVTDERTGGDEEIDSDVYVRTVLARPSVIGFVRAAGRGEAQALADRVAAAVSRLVCARTAALGPGWIDTIDKPAIIGTAPGSVEAIVSFELPLIVTYQHKMGDPTHPGC